MASEGHAHIQFPGFTSQFRSAARRQEAISFCPPLTLGVGKRVGRGGVVACVHVLFPCLCRSRPALIPRGAAANNQIARGL